MVRGCRRFEVLFHVSSSSSRELPSDGFVVVPGSVTHSNHHVPSHHVPTHLHARRPVYPPTQPPNGTSVEPADDPLLDLDQDTSWQSGQECFLISNLNSIAVLTHSCSSCSFHCLLKPRYNRLLLYYCDAVYLPFRSWFAKPLRPKFRMHVSRASTATPVLPINIPTRLCTPALSSTSSRKQEST